MYIQTYSYTSTQKLLSETFYNECLKRLQMHKYMKMLLHVIARTILQNNYTKKNVIGSVKGYGPQYEKNGMQN